MRPAVASNRPLRRLPVVDDRTTAANQASPSARRHLVLLSLDWTRDKDPRVPLGHASLLAALHEADAADVTALSEPINAPGFSVDKVLEPLLRAAHRRSADRTDVGIGVYIWNDHYVRRLLVELRRSGFAGRIVLGGPQISYSGPGLERLYPEADAFIRGYGEVALREFVQSGEPVSISGLHWAGQPDLGAQARPVLSSLPSPFLTGIVEVSRQHFLRWETQRGCPYRCSFCQHREAGARLSSRQRTLDLGRLREEMALFVTAGVEDIAVLDPIFNVGPDHLAILHAFQRLGYRGRLSLQCRFELVNQAFLEACQGLNVRLEFGLQTIHEEEGRAIRRVNQMDRVEQAMRELTLRSLPYEVSLIFGLPRQTLLSFLQTVDYCLTRGVPTIRAFPLMLLRGTELEGQREDFGLRENQEVIPAVVRSNSFSEEDWQAMAAIAAALDQTVGKHPPNATALLPHVRPDGAVFNGLYSPAREVREEAYVP